MEKKTENKRKISQFAVTTSDKKQKIMDGRKADNTNKATKLWIDVFKTFLSERNLPEVEEISDLDLPNAIEDFYVSLRSKRKLEEKEAKKSIEDDKEDSQDTVSDLNDDNEDCMYSNSTMKAIRAALNRYFKDTRKIDITSNAAFINANGIFQGNHETE